MAERDIIRATAIIVNTTVAICTTLAHVGYPGIKVRRAGNVDVVLALFGSEPGPCYAAAQFPDKLAIVLSGSLTELDYPQVPSTTEIMASKTAT